MQEFDKEYWEAHWRQVNEHGAGREFAPNPYLERETGGLTPGTALDAGCGEGAEAIWLATEGWRVTAADISSAALSRASARVKDGGTPCQRLQWVEADLSVWKPGEQFDLVTTHYAHPAMGQLEFYGRISHWVAPGGTLLIVGHLRTPDHGHGHEHEQRADEHNPPEETKVTAASITSRLVNAEWDIVTAQEHTRTITNHAGEALEWHDVVVRATRRPTSTGHALI